MSDNVILNANTPSQVTVRATNTAGVFTPHSAAELWVQNAAVSNTNQVPVVLTLSNGTIIVAGSNAFPVVENNSANIASQVANVAAQVANVVVQVTANQYAKVLLSNGAPIATGAAALPVVENSASAIAASVANLVLQVANVAVQAANTAAQVAANQNMKVLLSNGSLVSVGSNALPTTLANSSTVSFSHDVSVVFKGANATLIPQYVKISSNTTVNTVIVANTGTGIRVLSAVLTANGGPVIAQFASGNAGNVMSIHYLSNGGFNSIPYNPHGNFVTALNDALILVLNNANAVGGSLVYVAG